MQKMYLWKIVTSLDYSTVSERTLFVHRCTSIGMYNYWVFYLFQGMIALRRGATELQHEDYMDGIIEVQAKKKANLQYYA